MAAMKTEIEEWAEVTNEMLVLNGLSPNYWRFGLS